MKEITVTTCELQGTHRKTGLRIRIAGSSARGFTVIYWDHKGTAYQSLAVRTWDEAVTWVERHADQDRSAWTFTLLSEGGRP